MAAQGARRHFLRGGLRLRLDTLQARRDCNLFPCLPLPSAELLQPAPIQPSPVLQTEEKEGKNFLQIYHILYGERTLFLFRWQKVHSLPKHRRILGERIRKRRRQAQLSQEQLAEKADLSTVYVSRVECGKENISVDALARISNALNTSFSNLFRGL